MTGVIEAGNLPSNEKVYLKKSLGEWKVVYPIRNEDGSINWFNLITGGSLVSFVSTIVIVAVVCFFFLEYSSNMKICAEMFNQIKPLI